MSQTTATDKKEIWILRLKYSFGQSNNSTGEYKLVREKIQTTSNSTNRD